MLTADVYQITTLSDVDIEGTANDDLWSLREAVAHSAADGIHAGESDLITFDESLFDTPQTIALSGSGEDWTPIAITPQYDGVAVDDAATGTGYLMYSEESDHTRFGNVHSDNADHLVGVRNNGGQWQYNTNTAWNEFTPRATDVLLASVDYSADTVTDLVGTSDVDNGITKGYARGNLSFSVNRWDGKSNLGEFRVGGTFFDLLAPASPIAPQNELVISSSISIEGPGADLLKISGGGSTRVVKVDQGAALYLSGLTIADGYTTGSGGGVYSDGDLTLNGVVLVGNYAANSGGGLHSPSGELTVTETTFEANTANMGGGVYRAPTGSETTNIVSSTFHANMAAAIQSVHHGRGGGLYVAGGGTGQVEIVNSTISTNQASKGGGIHVQSSQPVLIVNSTVTRNNALPLGSASGGGVSGGGINIWQSGSDVTMHNTIVSENTATASYRTNMYGSLQAGSSHNLVQLPNNGSGTGGLTNGEDGNIILQPSESALLEELDDNGGMTMSHVPLADSPAVGAGSVDVAQNFELTGDQRNGAAAITDRFTGSGGGLGAASVTIGSIEFNSSMIEIEKPFLVNSDYVADSQAQSWVARNALGQTAVVWFGDGDEGEGVYAQLVNSADDNTSVPRRVDVAGSTISGPADDLQVAIDGEGRFAITWRVDDHIYLRRYDSNGTLVDDLPVLVSDSYGNNTGGEGNSISIVTNETGRIVVTWTGTDGNLYFRRFSTTGVTYDTSQRLAVQSGGETLYTSFARRAVSIGAADDFYLSYLLNDVVYLQHFSAGGIIDQQPSVVTIAEGSPDSPDPYTDTFSKTVVPFDLLVGLDGEVFVSYLYSTDWTDSSGGSYGVESLVLRRLDPDNDWGSEVAVAEGTQDGPFSFVRQTSPGLATDQLGRIGITWSQIHLELFTGPSVYERTIHVGWFENNGTLVTQQAFEASHFESNDNSESLDAVQPSLSSDAFGNYFLTGTIDDDIYAQRFSLPQPVVFQYGERLLVIDHLSEYDDIKLSSSTVNGMEVVTFNGIATSILTSDVTEIGIGGGSNDNRIDVSRVNLGRFPNLTGFVDVDGGAGDDVIIGSPLADVLIGGSGNDRIISGGGSDYLIGEAGNDTLVGGDGESHLYGGDGDDSLYGGSGNDELFGEEGNDRLFGGEGDDTLSGGTGNDRLDGGAGVVDALAGDDGDDVYVLTESTATTTISDSSGIDSIDLSTAGIAAALDLQQAEDLVTWAVFDPTIGADRILNIQAGTEVENIEGTNYDDTLFGNSADNRLSGGGGADVINGAGGGNILEGGLGDDTYQIDGSTSSATSINDASGYDSIDISAVNLDVGAVVDLGASGPDPEQVLNQSAGINLVSAGLSNVERVIGTPNLLDDADLTFAADWTDSAFAGGLYQSQKQLESTTSGQATWTFSGLTPGEYEVYVTWSPDPVDLAGTPTVGATNAPFTVTSAVSPVDVAINQQVNPTSDLEFAGRSWQRLANNENDPEGKFSPDGTDTLSVTLSTLNTNADGVVYADAVRVVRVNQEPTVEVIEQTGNPPGVWIWDITTTDLDGVPILSLAPGAPEAITLVDNQDGSGTLTWDSAVSASGRFYATVLATDAADPSITTRGTVEFDVTGSNTAPTLTVASAHAIDEASLLTVPLSSNDADGYFFSVEFDAPNGIDIVEPTTGNFELQWTPTADQVGTHTFNVHVTDRGDTPKRTSQSVTVTVNVVNDAPIVANTLRLAHDTSGTGGTNYDLVTADMTLLGEVTNDGSVELVDIEVDYSYDGSFNVDDVFEVVVLEDDPLSGTFAVEPSAASIADLLGNPTTVAVRAREWKADLSPAAGYHYST
ncbi:MAG: hypothetical protein ACR2NU_15425, partial [Aeoliella sp.]